MRNIMNKLTAFRGTCPSCSIISRPEVLKRNYVEEVSYSLKKEKKIHPYRVQHPWKSQKEFTDYLLKNVLYNKDDIVVLNKPYGISGAPQNVEGKTFYNMFHKIPNAVSYTISDSLKDIAHALGYKTLILAKNPERYMSGATLLIANKDLQQTLQRSSNEAICTDQFVQTYWVVTTRVPKELKGKKKLGLKLLYNPKTHQKKPLILHEWSNNQQKNGDVKILHVEFQVLSNSTLNLCSLVEIKASIRKWHALRLFAATELYSPVLGDNYHASRIQNIKDTWLQVDPFLPVTDLPPRLNSELLELLKLTPAKQEIIPVHIHLRKLHYPSLFKRNDHFTVEAPLLPPFDWTCKQLMFKYLMKEEDNDNSQDLKAAVAS